MSQRSFKIGRRSLAVRHSALAIACVAPALCASSALAQSFNFTAAYLNTNTVVNAAGIQVPGLTGRYSTTNLSQPATPFITNAGLLCFDSLLAGAGVITNSTTSSYANSIGAFVTDASGTRLSFRQNDRIPNTSFYLIGATASWSPTQQPNSPGQVRPQIDDAGDEVISVAYNTVSSTGALASVGTGLLFGKVGELHSMVTPNDPAPQLPGVTIKNTGAIRFAPDGSLGVATLLSSGPTIYYLGDGNGLNIPLAAPGTTDGLPSGIMYAGAGPIPALFAVGANKTAFYPVSLTNTPSGGLKALDATNNMAYCYRSPAGAISVVARLGDVAPGFTSGVTYIALNSPSMAGNNVLFKGSTSVAGDVTGTNNDAVWYGSPAAPAVVAREGDVLSPSLFTNAYGDDAYAVPVTFNNRTSSSPFSYVTLADSKGDIAFAADLTSALFGGTGTNANRSTGLFLTKAGHPEQTRLLALPGQPVPGYDGQPLGAGINWNAIPSLGWGNASAINELGQVAFYGALGAISANDPTLGNGNNEGIWYTDYDGVLRLLVREGDTLSVNGAMKKIGPTNVSSGSSTTVMSIAAGNGQDGSGTGLNDLGFLAVRASFVDATFAELVFNLRVINVDSGNTRTFSPDASADSSVVSINVATLAPAAGAAVRVTTVTARPGQPRTLKPTIAILTGVTLTNDGAPLGSRTYGGVVDLGTNDAVVKNGSLADLSDMARAFIASGGAAGLGSTSDLPLTCLAIVPNSDGRGGTLFSTFDGIAVTTSDVLAKFTYAGDTDLNGLVDGTDLANLLAGMNGGLHGWVNGDLNYDGTVDGADLSLLVTSLRGQGSSLGTPGGGTAGAVPEPSVLAALSLAVPACGRRRRRHR